MHALFLLAMLGCENPDNGVYRTPKFRQEKKLEFELLTGELPYSPHTILECDGKIVVTGYSGPSSETCFVYDTQGNMLRSGIMHGRGPSEVLMGYINVSSCNGRIFFHDIQTNEILSFCLSDFLDKGAVAAKKEKVDLSGWCAFFSYSPGKDLVEVISRSYMKDLDLPQRSIRFIKPDGATYEYDIAPYDDRAVSYYSTIQPRVVFSPDGKRMAIDQNVGMVLEIFSIEDGMDLVSKKKFFEPRITITEQGYSYEDNYVFSSEYLKATADRILVIYDGETTYAMSRQDEDRLLFKNIAAFDWNGEPKELYRTDYRVRNVCQVGNMFYAILRDTQGRCFIGRAAI